MSEIRVDTISEKTSANGVAVDGVTLKDGAITSTAASTITTADNTDTLSLISTDADPGVGPNLRLYRNSSSPADNDYNGAVQWEWRNDNSQDVIGAEIQSYTRDVTDGTEDNILWFQNMTQGTLTEFLRFDTQSDQATITFNENSNDIDFRVESNGNANMLFVDGGNDHVNIGTSSDLGGTLNVQGAAVFSLTGNGDTLTLISTDEDAAQGPNLRLYRNSASPADNDILGIIEFEGRNDNSQDFIAVQMESLVSDVSDGTEDAYLNISTMLAGSLRSRIEMDSGETVINEASQDLDFRVESDGVGHMLFVDAGNNRVAIGTSSPGRTLSIGNDGIIGLEGSSNAIAFTESSSLKAYIASQSFGDHNGDGLGIVTSGTEPIKFYTNGSEEMRIEDDGTVYVGTTSSDVGGNTSGILLGNDGYAAFRRSGATVLYVNRFTDDGVLINLYGQGSIEGTISVSGTTVSYNGFTGSHWSRLADNSKPTILRGTIMDSIDEMCDWYQAVAEVAEVLWTADDSETQNVLWTEDDILPEGVEVGDVKEEATKTVGDVKEEAQTVKESIALGDKSVGDAITFTSNGTEYTGTIVKEDDVKHTKCKVSDTADSKKVYGVFSNWDDADDGLDGDVNDMNIAQVGTFIIRVNADVTVEAGDLLVSNGDGTAKLQDDDIIRSKTVAKVNSNIKVETYSDGSYTVPCTLHC